jgi:hypothetical protein
MKTNSIDNFRIYEKVLIIVYFIVAIFVFDNLKYMIYYKSETFSLQKLLLSESSLTLYGILLISLISVLVVRNIYGLTIILGIFFGITGFIVSAFVNISIILVVWHGIMAAFLGGIFIIYDRLMRYSSQSNIVSTRENLTIIKNDIFELFKIIVQVFVACTATIGVCMSILFRFDLNDKELKIDAIWIVVGFGFCVAALVFWIILPIFKVLNEVNDKILKLEERYQTKKLHFSPLLKKSKY